MNPPRNPSSVRPGFSLVEVTLAIGIVGVAILSLVGILGSTFQQVDEIMQTNRALAGVGRLIGALDNPRSIVYLDASNQADIDPLKAKYLVKETALTLNLDGGNSTAANFDIAYRLLAAAKDNGASAVWLYVYERKIVRLEDDKDASGVYKLSSNPSVMEVAYCLNNNLTVDASAGRNIIGTPMRVRLSLSKLLVGQRASINASTFEPDTAKVPAPPWASSPVPAQPSSFALAYLPVVAEFFAHDYSPYSSFKDREGQPLLVQNIILSR